MNRAAKSILGLVAVVAVLVGIIVVWHKAHTPASITEKPSQDSVTQNVADFDRFQQDLATRVLQHFGAGSDFSVIVATTAYPVGTLLRATSSVPADLDDCVPRTLPQPFPAQRLFPSYTMSSDTALAANLGSRAIQGLDSAGVNLGQSQKIQYAISDTQILIMDDKSVDQVTSQGNCGKYISAHPGMRLIRGAVTGKMTFTVNVDNPASVKARLGLLGGFSIRDNPQSSALSIADQQNEPIVELLSEFGSGPAPTPTAIVTPLPAKTAPLPADAPVTRAYIQQRAHVFVQMDADDAAASGDKVVQLLQSGLTATQVEPKVQRIPTRNMPEKAQVRYFNESDAAKADRCASILKQIYPDTRVVRIGLPSPAGQLEVWLPKVRP